MSAKQSAKQEQAIFRGALLTPVLIGMGALYLLPLIWTLLQSFLQHSETDAQTWTWTLENYYRFFKDDYYLQDVLWRTVRLAAIATFFAVILGYIGALLLVRAPKRLRFWFMFLVMCPLWINLVVRTLSLMVILARNGIANKLLMQLGLINQPLQLLYNETSVMIGMIQVSIPFVLLATVGVLQSIPEDLEQAALTVGANRLQAFWKVILPISIPGVLAGTALGYSINVESFVVPILLGGGRIPFMSTASYDMAVISGQPAFAAAIGVVLLVVAMSTLGACHWLVKRMGARINKRGSGDNKNLNLR